MEGEIGLAGWRRRRDEIASSGNFGLVSGWMQLRGYSYADHKEVGRLPFWAVGVGRAFD